MHEFIIRNRNNGAEFTLCGIGRTADDARTNLLIYNLANTDLTVWELIG